MCKILETFTEGNLNIMNIKILCFHYNCFHACSRGKTLLHKKIICLPELAKMFRILYKFEIFLQHRRMFLTYFSLSCIFSAQKYCFLSYSLEGRLIKPINNANTGKKAQ